MNDQEIHMMLQDRVYTDVKNCLGNDHKNMSDEELRNWFKRNVRHRFDDFHHEDSLRYNLYKNVKQQVNAEIRTKVGIINSNVSRQLQPTLTARRSRNDNVGAWYYE